MNLYTAYQRSLMSLLAITISMIEARGGLAALVLQYVNMLLTLFATDPVVLSSFDGHQKDFCVPSLQLQSLLLSYILKSVVR